MMYILTRVGFLFLFFLHTCGFLLAQIYKDYPIQPIDFTNVKVEDNFWAPKIKINADVTIPYVFQKCEKEGRMDNFYRAAGQLNDDKSTTYPFDDSDLYKVIEGASYSLMSNKNDILEAYLDTLIHLIGSAQEEDGYLYTFRTMKKSIPHEWLGKKRWEKEEDLSHELYNAGHLYEAASAHFRATGKSNLISIAIKNADLLVRTFGWGKEEKFPGHQIIETGLVKLYRITGKKEYLNLAKFFIDLRGKEGHFNQEYSQSHIPVINQEAAVGHSVRATYMYSGIADVAALSDSSNYSGVIDQIWEDVVHKKIYITGGIGATRNGEAFGNDFELPNMSAYAETCAAIANVYWNSRMFALHGDSKYIDILERTLYNGLISGVSLSGDHFFYPNPLASIGQHQRSPWHNCACCVTNMARFLPSMPGYVYAKNENNLYVNLYVGSTSIIDLPNTKVELVQTTDYPWSGKIDILVKPEISSEFSVFLRIPGWAINKPVPGGLYTYIDKEDKEVSVYVNGQLFSYPVQKGYAVIKRLWNTGDIISFDLDMNVKKVVADEKVMANKFRFALEFGPLVYCIEGHDNKENTVTNILVDKNVSITNEFIPDLLNGIIKLKMKGLAYKAQDNSDKLEQTDIEVSAIPYYTWANRGPSEMMVWLPYISSVVKPKALPTIATKSSITSSIINKKMEKAINDQYFPSPESNDDASTYLHWWPANNSTEWVQYDFDQEYTISESSVFWFDDAPWGGCRTPQSWQILYKSEDKWIPVKNKEAYPVIKSTMNKVTFDPVHTRSVKLLVQLPIDNSSGIYEWTVK